MKTLYLSMLLMLSMQSFASTDPLPRFFKLIDKKETIKVYPTRDHAGGVTIFSAYAATISFYLFDVEGKLVYQTDLKQANEQMVKDLAGGTYWYTALDKDVKVEEAKIVIR